jgi:hypothetical protein
MNSGANLSDLMPQTQELEELSSLNGKSSASSQSRILSSLLSPAIRFWLRSQLDDVEELQFSIQAGDRRLLSGAIDEVAVSAHKAVYQGLHFSKIQLTGSGIRTNLGQILRGKPLRLLQEFPVVGEVLLHTADLDASLQSGLLGNAVLDVLCTLLQTQASPSMQPTGLHAPKVVLETEKLTFSAILVFDNGDTLPITLCTNLRVEQGNQLWLDRLNWRTHVDHSPQELDSMTFNLGPKVFLETLALEGDRLVCRGQIMVMPDGE